MRRQRFAPRLARVLLGRWRRLQLLEFFLDSGQVRVQGLFEQACLARVELLAGSVKAQPLVARQLVGKLVDARGLEDDLALECLALQFLLGVSLDQIAGQNAQLRRVQALEFRGVHHAPHGARR